MPSNRANIARKLALQAALSALLLGAAAGSGPLLDSAIALYQKTLSPAWDRPCAHARLHGGPSCSAHARARIAERGALAGAGEAMARFRACGRAAASYPKETNHDPKP